MDVVAETFGGFVDPFIRTAVGFNILLVLGDVVGFSGDVIRDVNTEPLCEFCDPLIRNVEEFKIILVLGDAMG